MEVPYITTESGGLRAFVDAYVLGVRNEGSVRYLSIFGAIGAVQAVSAALVSGRSVSLYGADEFGKELYRQFGGVKYRMISKRLPASKMLSMVVVVESALLSDNQDFVMIIKQNEDPKEFLFRNILHRSEVPVHQLWASWLWEAFVKNELITELTGYRMGGYRVNYTDEELAKFLEIGIKRHEIP
ncbi:hypothetical protein KAR91_75145 [Candidatus Pacearchaeota archaeon]|nr:hypothetical protein [Candidatus Pacearchaeota archaeon]